MQHLPMALVYIYHYMGKFSHVQIHKCSIMYACSVAQSYCLIDQFCEHVRMAGPPRLS